MLLVPPSALHACELSFLLNNLTVLARVGKPFKLWFFGGGFFLCFSTSGGCPGVVLRMVKALVGRFLSIFLT